MVTPTLTAEQIARCTRVERAVAAALDLDPATLGTRRHGRITFARQICMHTLRRRGFGLVALARRYARDHTTVLHAIRVIDAAIAEDAEVHRLVTHLDRVLDA